MDIEGLPKKQFTFDLRGTFAAHFYAKTQTICFMWVGPS